MKRWKAAAGSILAVTVVALGMAILAPTMAPKAEAGASENLQAKMLKLGLAAANPALKAGCTYKAVWSVDGKTLNIQLFNPDGSPATNPDITKWFGEVVGALTSRVSVYVYGNNPKVAWVKQSFFLNQGGKYVFYGKMTKAKL